MKKCYTKNMDKTQEAELKSRIENMLPTLNEYQKRRYLAIEAKAIGYGGVSIISRLSGSSHKTIKRGIQELETSDSEALAQKRIRLKGGGRKPIYEEQPEILNHLKELVAPHTKGDPTNVLLWTNKSLRSLASALTFEGFRVSHVSVGEMLKKLGYSLQANKKTLTATAPHPDRNEQFEYINKEINEANAQGFPVLSIDAKKKENLGNFKNNGQTYQEEKNPTLVLDHDFPIKELGKATPYGIYNIFKNQGFVSVGISHDTASFAVESVRKWWYAEGIIEYADADEIIITADCGGSNGNRNRLWKWELQNFANETGKIIRILHYPPGCSKWNKIEHRLFSFISMNWRGIPLLNTAIILSLIGATHTTGGLTVNCTLDETFYKKGVKVSVDDFASINILADDFHGDWNYKICPNPG